MDTAEILESAKIRLRALEPDDVDLLYSWENDNSNWKVSNTLSPFSRYIIAKYLKTSHRDIYEAKELRLIIVSKHDERPVGTIDLFDFDPFHNRAGIGILIACEEDRKKGMASETLKLIIRYVFKTLGLHQLYCNISADNEASLSLFRKFGFEISGLKKEWNKTETRWTDEYFLQLINN